MATTAPASVQATPTACHGDAPPASSNAEPSPAIQQLHQQQPHTMTALEMQRQLLAQKLAQQPVGFISPTDEMMTPCSKKLQDHKKKAFVKAKPSSLMSRFKNAMAESKERQADAAAAPPTASGFGGELFGTPPPPPPPTQL